MPEDGKPVLLGEGGKGSDSAAIFFMNFTIQELLNYAIDVLCLTILKNRELR